MNSLRTPTKLFVVMLALAMGGCFETDLELLVNKDGSGALTQTLFLGQQMSAMMKMGKEAEEGQGGKSLLESMIDKDELAAKAKELGEGVTVKSAEILKDDKGREGVKIVFAVKDVNNFKMPLGGESGGFMGMQGDVGPEGENQEQKTETATIKFAKAAAGKPATLTVLMPWPQAEEKAEGGEGAEGPQESPEEDPSTDDQPETGGAFMTRMLADMRMRVTVKVDGKITKTNATHVHEDKSGITLVDMNIGRLATDEKLAERLLLFASLK